jgi:hypothetical protein
MKKNDDTKPESVQTSRRRFLTTFAAGATAAPLLSLSRGLFADSSPPPSADLCFSNKRLLGPSDFNYLGAMRVPASGVDMTFSQGGMTGRKVNGQVQLLMVGSRNVGDPVYELADTGAYHANPAQAPRMSLLRDWGGIYGNVRKSWRPNGTEKNLDATRYMGAFHFNPATNLLYWTYADAYNTTGDEDWCLGATRLDANGPVALGPWRPAGEGKKGPWRCVRLAQHPITGEMLCGSGVMAGNASSPWGPDLWGGQFPTASTPGGFGAPDVPIQKYLTYYPMVGRVNRDGTFQGPIRSCRRPGDYFFEPIHGESVSFTEVDPQKNGGVGSWTQVDTLGGSVWIDLPDVHGMVFTGKLGAGHVWYSNVGQGNLLCTHGVASPVVITGSVCSDAYPVMMVYDPTDLNAVRAGSRVDYTTEPVHVLNAQARFGVATSAITEVGTAKILGGAYFDPETRKLYVAAPQADATIGGFLNPLVHVFRIA